MAPAHGEADVSLAFEEATSFHGLLSAAERAARGKRHRPEVARFLMDAEKHCLALERALRLPAEHPQAWRPGAVRRFPIRDPKPRTITEVPFPDRVVHHALMAVAEPYLERRAIFDSYACRIGKGQHAALHRTQRFAGACPWALKADIAAYFASIPLQGLMALVRRCVPDRATCDLLERIVRSPRLETAPGRGLPIGALTSQHLANLYLSPLDHWLKDDLGVRRYVRYMDDFVVFGERAELRDLRMMLGDFLEQRLGLSLNPRGTRVLPTRDGIPFLGFSVRPGRVRARPATARRFRRRLAALEARHARGEITEEELAARLGSVFAHLRAWDTHGLRANALARHGGREGADRPCREPREPRWLVELDRPELPGCVPQQLAHGRAQPQPRLSRCELSPSWPDAGGSRTADPRPGADQVCVLCPGVRAHGGTESLRPGSGPRSERVAAGRFLIAGVER